MPVCPHALWVCPSPCMSHCVYLVPTCELMYICVRGFVGLLVPAHGSSEGMKLNCFRYVALNKCVYNVFFLSFYLRSLLITILINFCIWWARSTSAESYIIIEYTLGMKNREDREREYFDNDFQPDHDIPINENFDDLYDKVSYFLSTCMCYRKFSDLYDKVSYFISICMCYRKFNDLYDKVSYFISICMCYRKRGSALWDLFFLFFNIFHLFARARNASIKNKKNREIYLYNILSSGNTAVQAEIFVNVSISY